LRSTVTSMARGFRGGGARVWRLPRRAATPLWSKGWTPAEMAITLAGDRIDTLDLPADCPQDATDGPRDWDDEEWVAWWIGYPGRRT